MKLRFSFKRKQVSGAGQRGEESSTKQVCVSSITDIIWWERRECQVSILFIESTHLFSRLLCIISSPHLKSGRRKKAGKMSDKDVERDAEGPCC